MLPEDAGACTRTKGRCRGGCSNAARGLSLVATVGFIAGLQFGTIEGGPGSDVACPAYGSVIGQIRGRPQHLHKMNSPFSHWLGEGLVGTECPMDRDSPNIGNGPYRLQTPGMPEVCEADTAAITEPATMCALGLAVLGVRGYIRKHRICPRVICTGVPCQHSSARAGMLLRPGSRLGNPGLPGGSVATDRRRNSKAYVELQSNFSRISVGLRSKKPPQHIVKGGLLTRRALCIRKPGRRE